MRPAQRRVGLSLAQRKSGGEERDERLAQRPLVDGPLQNGLLVENEDLELRLPVMREGADAIQDLHHGTRFCLLRHRANADDDWPAPRPLLGRRGFTWAQRVTAARQLRVGPARDPTSRGEAASSRRSHAASGRYVGRPGRTSVCLVPVEGAKEGAKKKKEFANFQSVKLRLNVPARG